uniref:Uncharacterized protein n=1 Tax=Meloidogyne enterolobii TaxID=390850 RepID=A0A6V7Y2J5_MELEN|nr:unnamed protein product [Meloidogyne enterolobii]
MVTYELFILYWRNHIKAMLTTSRIIYVLCEKKFGERETKLFVGIEAKQIHSRSELVQCFLRINERAEETVNLIKVYK